MKKIVLIAVMLFYFAGAGMLAAQDKAATAPAKEAEAQSKDVKKEKIESKLAGRWEGKITRQSGEEMKLIYTFKIDGEKLTGAVESPMGESTIDNGKAKGDEFSFNVDRNGSITEYQGKLADGKIKMKSKGPRGEREITLSRPVEINGRWLSKFETPDGESMEITFTFKVDGEKLTGKVASPMAELDITNGKVKGEDFTFDVDLGGNIIGHECKISGDEIKLKVKGFGDESQARREITLKRVPAK